MTRTLQDAIRDTPIFGDIARWSHYEGFQEGYAKGFQQGHAKGLEEGRKIVQEVQRQLLIRIVSERFPRMVRITRKQISDIDHTDILKHLIIKMGNAQTLEEAMLYLIEADEDEDEE
jgi:flagellar biosynthesis/type III secretory pathway protein FliH